MLSMYSFMAEILESFQLKSYAFWCLLRQALTAIGRYYGYHFGPIQGHLRIAHALHVQLHGRFVRIISVKAFSFSIRKPPYAVACQIFHIVCADCWYLHHGYALVCLVRRTVNSLIWDSIVHAEVRADIFMLIHGAIVSAVSPPSLEGFLGQIPWALPYFYLTIPVSLSLSGR